MSHVYDTIGVDRLATGFLMRGAIKEVEPSPPCFPTPKGLPTVCTVVCVCVLPVYVQVLVFFTGYSNPPPPLFFLPPLHSSKQQSDAP